MGGEKEKHRTRVSVEYVRKERMAAVNLVMFFAYLPAQSVNIGETLLFFVAFLDFFGNVHRVLCACMCAVDKDQRSNVVSIAERRKGRSHLMPPFFLGLSSVIQSTYRMFGPL